MDGAGPTCSPVSNRNGAPVAARTIADASANNKALAHHFASDLLGQDGPEADTARRITAQDLQVKKSEFHSLGLVLGYNYADSPLVTGDGTPLPAEDPIHYTPSAHPGCLLPHVWLADGFSVYDRLGKGFTLITVPGVNVDIRDITATAASHGIPLTTLALQNTDIDASSVQNLWHAPLLLVRPDQHVAWRGDDVSAAATALARAAGW